MTEEGDKGQGKRGEEKKLERCEMWDKARKRRKRKIETRKYRGSRKGESEGAVGGGMRGAGERASRGLDHQYSGLRSRLIHQPMVTCPRRLGLPHPPLPISPSLSPLPLSPPFPRYKSLPAFLTHEYAGGRPHVLGTRLPGIGQIPVYQVCSAQRNSQVKGQLVVGFAFRQMDYV